MTIDVLLNGCQIYGMQNRDVTIMISIVIVDAFSL